MPLPEEVEQALIRIIYKLLEHHPNTRVAVKDELKIVDKHLRIERSK